MCGCGQSKEVMDISLTESNYTPMVPRTKRVSTDVQNGQEGEIHTREVSGHPDAVKSPRETTADGGGSPEVRNSAKKRKKDFHMMKYDLSEDGVQSSEAMAKLGSSQYQRHIVNADVLF